MALWSDTLPASIEMVKENLYLMPLCIFYAIALFFGLLGKKYLDASVVSPLENIDGAMAAIILYVYFLLVGYTNVTNNILLFVDLMDSFGNLLRATMVTILSRKLSKDLRYEYNYGVGKIESIVSLFCSGIIFFGLLITIG